jgi:hypothetical protein
MVDLTKKSKIENEKLMPLAEFNRKANKSKNKMTSNPSISNSKKPKEVELGTKRKGG